MNMRDTLILAGTLPLLVRADIRKQPEFRAQFHAMCVSIGVDPLASNKGIWNKILGLGGTCGICLIGVISPAQLCACHAQCIPVQISTMSWACNVWKAV